MSLPHVDGSAPIDGPGRGLWVGLILGGPLMAFGIVVAIDDAARTHPSELTRWIVGSAVVHDVLVVPLVLAVAAVGRRVVPPLAWPAVRWAAAATAILGVVSIPFARGWGRSPDVPSLLDRDYGTGVLALVGVVWLVAGLSVAIAGVRRRRRRAQVPLACAVRGPLTAKR